MNQNDLLTRVLFLVPTILSLSVHEWAHAFSAHKLGDDTAESQGRLTLNPLVHIDLMGTLILPLLGIPFGWAKPVPVNPTQFRKTVNMRTGMAITAAAGPISNFILALISALILGIWLRFSRASFDPRSGLFLLLFYSIQLNIGLGLFNLLPVPPLDGSRLLEKVLGDRFPAFWGALERYGRLLIIVLFVSGGFIIARPRAALEKAMATIVFHVGGLQTPAKGTHESPPEDSNESSDGSP